MMAFASARNVGMENMIPLSSYSPTLHIITNLVMLCLPTNLALPGEGNP